MTRAKFFDDILFEEDLMVWQAPIFPHLVESSESLSFLTLPKDTTALPLLPHPGAFGAERRYHVHKGVDLYCSEGAPVHAVEEGEVVACLPFTGPLAGSPWWLDTHAVFVEGQSGLVVYGEISLLDLQKGETVRKGEPVGTVSRVLRHDKGRPLSMLHLELYKAGTREVHDWNIKDGTYSTAPRPAWPSCLRDPTPYLQKATPLAL